MIDASNRREGHVFPRRLDPPLPVAVKADGVWIEDQDGNRYLDASGGAIVVNVGHGRKEIARAVYDQILAYDYIHPTMFTTPAAEALATALAAEPGRISVKATRGEGFGPEGRGECVTVTAVALLERVETG